MKEIWKDIPGWKGYYQASSLGRIRSVDRDVYREDGATIHYKSKILHLNNAIKGYYQVSLSSDNAWHSRTVNRLVAMTFCGIPKKEMVTRHLDGNPKNNRIENLKWGTVTENNRDKAIHGTNGEGEENGSAKLKNCEAALAKRIMNAGFSTLLVGKMFLVCRRQMLEIRKNKCFKNTEPL